MTHLTLVRHGTTQWMERGRLHGISDSPLSERGLQEAHRVAKRLAGKPFDAFYTSPLGRARQTAEIIGEAIGLEPVPLEGLRELDFGWMEGGPTFDFSKDAPLKRVLRSAWIESLVRLTGEPRPRFIRRVAETVKQIVERHPEGRVLIVTHSAVHSNLLGYFLHGDPSAWVKYDGWAPCAITELEVTPTGEARLISLNEREHLSDLKE